MARVRRRRRTTSGLRVFLFGGRYFVSCNIRDGSPGGTGKPIVGDIPCDPEQYQAWLNRQRERFASLTERLEKFVLLVTEYQLQRLSLEEATNKHRHIPFRANALWLSEIDYDLTELPTPFCQIEVDRYTDWVYVVDLDRQLFSVNNSIFFNLWDVCHPRWIDAFKCDDVGNLSFAFDTAPEGIHKVEPLGYFNGYEDDREKYCNVGRQYHSVILKAKAVFELPLPESPGQILAQVLFDEFMHVYSPHIRRLFPGGVYNSFGLREMAYAVLSFASGQFYLDNPARFYGGTGRDHSHGYVIAQDGAGKITFMPQFRTGCHLEGYEPGSAPVQCMFWFHDILVSIVPDTTLHSDTDALIAKSVEFGREQGRSDFSIVLFSISSAVFLQVCLSGESTRIRRTEPVTIYDQTVNDGDELENSIENCRKEESTLIPLSRLRSRNQGFSILQDFFAKAAAQNLARFNRGIFPVEIYDNIIEWVDCSMLRSCAQVSMAFNILCQKHFAFSQTFQIVHFEPETMPSPYRHKSGALFPTEEIELGVFTFRDDTTGEIEDYVLELGGDGTLWSPVIGSELRPSMMTEVSLRTSVT